MDMVCSINGNILDTDDANISISDLGLLRGYGVFDFFRVEDNVPLFIDDHIDRFYSSAEVLRLKIPFTKTKLKEHILEIVLLNRLTFSGVRLLLTGGEAEDGYTPGQPNLIITQELVKRPDDAVYQAGVKLIKHEFERELPEVKTTGYLTSIWLQDQMAKTGAVDVVYYSKGLVAELSRSSIFIVRADGVVVTPGKNVLAGVTRKNVLEIAKNQYDIQLADVTLEDLDKANEVFITSTIKRIVPVVQIEDKTYGEGMPGRITKALSDKLMDFETEYIHQHRLMV